MYSPILMILFWILPSGGISVSCQTVNGGIFGKSTQPSESWSLTCLDEFSSTGAYHYVPFTPLVLVPACGTSGTYSVSATRIRVTTGLQTVVTSNLDVAWLCPDPKPNFDSSFNMAISDVGKSVNFWSLFLAGIGAGIFIGVAPLTVQSIRQLLDGGKDEL